MCLGKCRIVWLREAFHKFCNITLLANLLECTSHSDQSSLQDGKREGDEGFKSQIDTPEKYLQASECPINSHQRFFSSGAELIHTRAVALSVPYPRARQGQAQVVPPSSHWLLLLTAHGICAVSALTATFLPFPQLISAVLQVRLRFPALQIPNCSRPTSKKDFKASSFLPCL